jgi:hypothetical protein
MPGALGVHLLSIMPGAFGVHLLCSMPGAFVVHLLLYAWCRGREPMIMIAL